MITKISPCYKCEARHPACHDKCKAYKEWRKEFDKVKKAEWETRNNPADQYTQELIESNKARAIKKKRR